jgi:hypothetical protein
MTAPQYPSNQYPAPQYPAPQQPGNPQYPPPQPYTQQPPPSQYGQQQYPPYGQQYAGYGQSPRYGPPPVVRNHHRAEGVKQIVGGLIALVVGLAITIGTYTAASGGGVYFVAYGPMIFGVIYLIKGLVNVSRG